MYNLNEKISNNFFYYEFFKSSTALRLNINNIPKQNTIWENIKNLTINCLQPIRNQFGPIRILSGYRSPELNQVVGGSLHSNHMFGLAADIEPIYSNVKLINVLNWIYDNLNYKELIAEYFPNGWIHLAFENNNDNNKELKLKDKKHNYSIVDINYINNIYKEQINKS